MSAIIKDNGIPPCNKIYYSIIIRNGIRFSEKFSELNELTIYDQKIDSLDIKSLVHLKSLSCVNSGLKELNIESNISLEYLNCSRNLLTSIVFNKNNNKLKTVNVGYNKLKTINVLHLVNLETLFFNNNEIGEEFYLCNNNKLEHLYCSNNNIHLLETTYCYNLKTLICDNNKLCYITLCNSHNLRLLSAANNKLTDLYVDNNYLLEHINFNNNRILKINFQNCLYLQQCNIVKSNNKLKIFYTYNKGDGEKYIETRNGYYITDKDKIEEFESLIDEPFHDLYCDVCESNEKYGDYLNVDLYIEKNFKFYKQFETNKIKPEEKKYEKLRENYNENTIKELYCSKILNKLMLHSVILIIRKVFIIMIELSSKTDEEIDYNIIINLIVQNFAENLKKCKLLYLWFCNYESDTWISLFIEEKIFETVKLMIIGKLSYVSIEDM